MIPKVIHYCWFGENKLPELAVKCIESWKKYCPDYEIKLWNEDNFDINIIPYVKQAYENKKYAFVTDFARLWILYNYGGIYLDTDVEIIKPFDDLLDCSSFFASENNITISTGLGFGAVKRNSLVKKMMDEYFNMDFVLENGNMNIVTCPILNSKSVEKDFLSKIVNKNIKSNIDGNYYYPKEYFCPIDVNTFELKITKNTYSIHHFAGSWNDSITSKYNDLRKKFISKFGLKIGLFLALILFFIIHPIYMIKKVVKKIFKK